MELTSFSIRHFNNTLDLFSGKEIKYSSGWFMDFGKFGCDILNQDKKIVYKITKQFQFWKWKMVYHIKKNNDTLSDLISQNNRKTIYAVDVDQIHYEIKIHYKKKLSIYKNAIKIAEIDESFSVENYKENIKFLVLNPKDLEICFMLFSCLKIGEVGGNKKPTFTSQKQLEVNEDPWS
tara:strand:- start:30340 stop:30873 length:534 start_codon:yes stop_codon:yes gene_type:complete